MEEGKPRASTGANRRTTLLMPAMFAVGAAPAAKAASRSPPLSLDDRVAIQDLFSTYLWALDCGDEDGFVELFTNDGLIFGLGRRYVGDQAMREWFRRLVAMRDAAGDAWLHEAGQFKFEGDDRACIVYAYATHFRMHPPTRELGVRSLGYYVNECVKTRGVWKFRRFSINRWDNNTQPWKKPKPWDAPETE